MYKTAQQCPHCHHELEQMQVEIDPVYPDSQRFTQIEWVAVCIDCDYSEPITD